MSAADCEAPVLSLAVRHGQGDFRLEVQWSGPCRFLGLFGPSGSGKTTLLEVLAGLRRPGFARLALGGDVLSDTAEGTDVPARRRGIGYVPQDSALFPHLTVRGNVLYGATRGPEVPLDPVLVMLGIEGLVDRRIAGLSGGERQRVSLARALVSSPRLLLLDEPLSAVEVPLRRRILRALADRVAADGVPTIHVSHDAADLHVAADRVLFLNDGRITREGDAGDLPV